MVGYLGEGEGVKPSVISLEEKMYEHIFKKLVQILFFYEQILYRILSLDNWWL